MVILELIRARKIDCGAAAQAAGTGRSVFIRYETNVGGRTAARTGARRLWVSHDNLIDRRATRRKTGGGDVSFKCLPYHTGMVAYWATMVATGNGELGFDSGEGA